MDKTIFDKTDVYQSEIAPLVKQKDELCGRNQIPFFFCAAVANDEEKTSYENQTRTGLPMGVHLTNDQMTNHVKVAAGFDVILPDVIPDIEL